MVDFLSMPRGARTSPVRGLDPVFLEQGDGAPGREVPALAVGRANLEGGDDLAVALERRHRHGTRDTLVDTLRRSGAKLALERTVERRAGDAVKLGNARDQSGPLGIERRKLLQP